MGGKRYPGEMSWLLYFSPYLAIIYNKLGKWLKVTSVVSHKRLELFFPLLRVRRNVVQPG